MIKLGILIIGYKNTYGVQRLLSSLDKVDFGNGDEVTLIFSIDYSGDHSVEKIAHKYEWRYGKKIIKAHRKNLGLQKHILSCGNYLEEYELDAMAVLEDDIYVSPEMYNYMKASVLYYKDDSRIAGIALYKHEYNINAKHPFLEYCDGGDTYFVQYAMSWGQVWLKEQWKNFRSWYDSKGWENIEENKIPQNIMQWKNSWLKYHIMYCIDKGLFFVYPRIALSTNFSDPGTHNVSRSTAMQIQLCMKKKGEWEFNKLDESYAIYDAFFENIKLKEYLNLKNLEIDLFGVKKYSPDTQFILTRNVLPYKSVSSWGLYLRPIEANVFLNIPGNDIFLYDLSKSKTVKTRCDIKHRYFEYDLKGLNILSFDNVHFCASKVIHHVIQKILQYCNVIIGCMPKKGK